MKRRNTPSELAAPDVDVDAAIDGDIASLLGSLEDDAPPPGAQAALLARMEADADRRPSPPGSSPMSLKSLALVAGLLAVAGFGATAVTRDDATASVGAPVRTPAVVSSEAAASSPLVDPSEIGRAMPPQRAATPSAPAPLQTGPAADPVSPRASLKGASALPSSRSPRAMPAPTSSAAVVVVENKDSFRDELAIVESARHSLLQGNTAECLATLRRYEEKYPSRLFATEARVVRAEALMAAGESEKASALAQELIAAEPRGPYAARLRALLQKTDGLDP